MKNLKFYKEWDGRWYVDLPEWKGSKVDLEMVAGADKMLDHISDGKNEIWLILSKEEFENAEKLEFVRNADEFNHGAFYKLEKYNEIEINLELWLCDVTMFVFGKFPKTIFIKKLTEDNLS
jgi:hypothetical protein